MKALISNIEQWADERNLIKGSTPDNQMLKLMEEFGELCGGIAKNKPDVIKDSIGDCMVVLIILSKQLGLGSDHNFDELNKKFSMPDRLCKASLASLDFAVHYGQLARSIGMVDAFGLTYPSNIVFDLIRCYGSLLAICYTQKLNIQDCLQHAYDQIKDRKGKMIDGVFVKEEDYETF